jgi:hypothetical protein
VQSADESLPPTNRRRRERYIEAKETELAKELVFSDSPQTVEYCSGSCFPNGILQPPYDCEKYLRDKMNQAKKAEEKKAEAKAEAKAESKAKTKSGKGKQRKVRRCRG